MVSEALDGLTDEQLADLELQESGLVSGQNEGAIASTPFAQRMNSTSAPEPEPEAPVALSDYELNKLEEENYRRTDYVMTPQEFDQYWDRREKEDNEVGRFLDGLGQGAAGLVGMVPDAANEITGALIRGVQDPIGQAKQNIQTGAEIIRKGGINLVQLFDWVSNKYDDLATSSKRAEAINAGIRARLEAEGRFTGDRTQDEQIYQAALVQAREAGAYTPTADQVREDRQKAYERYVREKALERDFAAVTDFKTGESQMSVPTSAEDYQITNEKPLPTVSTLGSMVVDPVNLVPLGAGALSKARVLRRIANLSEKPLLGAERVASGLADTAERIELGISTRLQDITGLTSKQQAALGAGVAGTAVYVDSATEGGGGLTKAVLLAGGILPTLHYGGALLRKVGSAAGGTATIVREAGVGGLGVARAEAASNLAGNAAIPERYRKFFTGYVDGTDSTLKRVAQNADNPEALRRVSRFADRMGATQVARVADDAVSGAVTAGIVGTPFAALQPDAERAGEVMGGILALGGAGGVVGGLARRAGTAADADIARMFADVQAVGGNVEAFARLPHATLDRLAAMQGVLAGKVDFVPLTGDEYRMNADIAQNGGEATAGVFLDRDANNRARVFINLDGKTATDAIAPHEIGHAILTSNVLDGQPRNDLRNLVNQQYGPEGVEARGREYIARMVDADLRQGVTGEAPTVLTEAEMKAMEGGKTMDDIVADRAKDPAERDRLINERMEEFRQRSIDKGEDAMDWARDEIIAETFASEAPAIDFRAIRRDAMFPRLAESILSAGGRVLEVFGANLSSTGKLMDNPSVLFRDNPLFQDRIMQKRVREYVRSYDQYLAGLEEAGAKELRGVELARSSKPEDLARSTHVKLRDEGRGVLENDFLFQKPDGTYSLKPQKIITATENARSAQIKTLYDARKFVPVNSQEFGKRKVNGREVIGGPVLPPQFDLFTNFPKHVRESARLMERSREEGGSWDIDYNAIGTGASGRYRVTNLGNVRAIQRETVPLGWQVTKANHLLAVAIDLNAFRAATMKAINRGELSIFNNDMRQVEADLKIRLANHREGRPGEAGIGQAKRDILNGLIGTGTAVQRAANPLYAELNPRGSLRTWRVDRLNDAKPTGRTGYFFDYDKENNNRMPQALPREAMGMPDGGPTQGTTRTQAQFMPDSVVKDEGGTVWRTLQDAPVITLKDLKGRKVFAAFADLTSAGKIYRGIDSSEIAVPVETHGGPEWPLLQAEKVGEETNVWSNQGAGVSAIKARRANEGAIMLIAAMDKNAHVSNTETATAVIATNAAYARDGRITQENLAALDNSIRKEIEDFPGIESPSIMEYVNKLPFQGKKSRARIAEILESKEAQNLGAANVQRILDEMRSDQYDGLRNGDVVLAIELTPGAPAVKLGEQGTLRHPSYQYALRGRVIGRFARPINITSIFDDFYAQRRADGKPELGDRRAFDLAKPVQEITDTIAARIPGTPYNSFRSPRHAQLIKMAIDDKWRSSEQTVKAGGVSPAEFIDALNASPAKLALDRYTLGELQTKLKSGAMSIYQLGDSQVFFGIKQGDPASSYGQDPASFGFGPNEKTLSLVLNNERKTGGMADAIVMKSLQLGVTALDCFAVKSPDYPSGMLPKLYASYGFEKTGTIPFDPQYYSKTELADLKKYWKSIGWDESLGLPEIVLMKWKGNDELRTKSLREIVEQSSTGVRGRLGQAVADARDSRKPSTRAVRGRKRRSGQGDAGAGARSQEDAGGGVRISRGFLGAYDELLSMSPEELRNLGIK